MSIEYETVRCSNPNCRTRFSWTDYTPPQPEWKPEPKPATPDITDHDGPRSVSEADWLEFNTEANDYGVPDRAGLQSVIDVIGEHYLHLAREWGWNDTEVRDAMYVETKTERMVQGMSVVTPEIRFFADCHWLMADNIILLKITPMLPYEWSNLRRLFDCKSTFETRSGPFDYWRIRLEFDGNLIHWTVSDGWWHPKTTTFDTDYETTMTVLFDVGYDQWRKDRGIMDEADKAVKRLNDSGIPATRSSDPDYLVFEVGESVFRALLPADPTHAASRLIEAVRNRGKILDGYRKTVAGLGRVEALEADDVYWDDLFSNGDPVETGAVIFQSQGAEDHPISLDLLIMSDGTWQPDGFDSDREGTAADVRGYLSQWTGDNRSITAMTSIAVCPCPVVRTEQTDG